MARSTPSENTESTAVALFGEKDAAVPAHLQTAAPAGNENVTSGDRSVPKLNLLQKLSPEVDSIAEAQPGMLLNTVSKELYDNVNVVNLFFKKAYAVFKKRTLGSGFEGNFPTLEAATAHRATLTNPDDYDIIDTDQHFCLLLDEEGKASTPILMYMSGSKLGVSKDWNSDISLRGPNLDRFAGVWNISSKTETNRRGQPYENLVVDFMGWAPEDLYAEAKKAYEGFANEAAAATAAPSTDEAA